MTYDFHGKVAVVTGASRGLGEAIARTLAADGARTVLVARSAEALAALARDLPHDPIVVAADLGHPDGWRLAAAAILEASPQIDILVNNAGMIGRQPLADLQVEDFDQVMTLNTRNLVLLTHALGASLIAQRGCVVNISSVASFTGGIGQIAYSTSKGAVNAFTRNASIDLGRHGVRVNAIAPGVIDDGVFKTLFANGMDREETRRRYASRLPLEGRWGSAQHVADAVAWLASDKADYVTGQVIRVDGGMIT